MTIRELGVWVKRNKNRRIPEDAEVLLSIDEEGNSFRKMLPEKFQQEMFKKDNKNYIILYPSDEEVEPV